MIRRGPIRAQTVALQASVRRSAVRLVPNRVQLFVGDTRGNVPPPMPSTIHLHIPPWAKGPAGLFARHSGRVAGR